MDESERQLRARPSHPTPEPELTDALLNERTKSLKHTPNLVESLPRRIKVVLSV